MNEKAATILVLTIVILAGIGGLYVIYNATYGKSIAGTEEYLEALHHRQLAEKALELEIDADTEINSIYSLLREGKKACVTLVNTRTFAIQQKFVSSAYEIAGIENMVEVRSLRLGPTWRIVNVDEVPCKPLEKILDIEKPIIKY